LLGWKEDEWRKQAEGVSVVPPEKRPRTKDDDEDEEDWNMTLNRYATLGTVPPRRRALKGLQMECVNSEGTLDKNGKGTQNRVARSNPDLDPLKNASSTLLDRG
jgi:hypothetical protein